MLLNSKTKKIVLLYFMLLLWDFNLVFRVMSSVLDVRSHYFSIVWHSEPSSYVFSLAFRVMSTVLGVQSHSSLPVSGIQSHVFSLAFRAMSSVSGVQNHYLSIVWHSESSSCVFSLAFRAIIICLQFSVQSNVFGFRHLEPLISSSFRHSKPCL